MGSSSRGRATRTAVAHWGASEWRKNLDELATDRDNPQAFPAQHPMDLMGRLRVRLCAEDGNLVAYGFGGQRFAFPAASVGAVHTVGAFRMGGFARGRSLLVLGHDGRVMLRASGLWQTYGEVKRVCRAARVPAPEHIRSLLRGRRRARTATLRYEKAPGYRRLRTRPRGTTLRVLAQVVLFGLTAGLGVFAGVLPAVALPEWTGAVRTLIGVVGVLLGMAGGLWLGAAISHVTADGVRWAVTSWVARTPAPAGRFFGRRRERSALWRAAANAGLLALVPALVGWGPGVGIASLAHGFRDASLVAELRQDGSLTRGTLVDVPHYSTDDDGNPVEVDVPTLSFLGWQATDPSIGGRPLPLDASDPMSTREPETVVYLPYAPDVAAARQQITGSVWHGAPTANLISGGLFTLALPPLLLFLVLRARRRRWRGARDLVDDLTS